MESTPTNYEVSGLRIGRNCSEFNTVNEQKERSEKRQRDTHIRQSRIVRQDEQQKDQQNVDTTFNNGKRYPIVYATVTQRTRTHWTLHDGPITL